MISATIVTSRLRLVPVSILERKVYLIFDVTRQNFKFSTERKKIEIIFISV